MSARFTVRVWDNFHYQDDDEAYDAGEFDTYEEALARAKAIVEESVENHRYDIAEYLMFGDDPSVLCPTGGRHPHFSGRAFASELCARHRGDE